MTDLQFSFSRKDARKLLKILEKHEESIRAEMPDTRLGAPALTEQQTSLFKCLEAKQDEVMHFIDILEKRLSVIDREGINFLAKHEKRYFSLGREGKNFPTGELPESLLNELEEHGINEDKFLDACIDAYRDGREKYNEEQLYNPKTCEHVDPDERAERAMQAGMAFGCQGYNDEMGY